MDDPSISDTSPDGSSVDGPQYTANLNNNSNVPSSPDTMQPKEVSSYDARLPSDMPTSVEAPEGNDRTRHKDPEQWRTALRKDPPSLSGAEEGKYCQQTVKDT